MRRVIKMNPCIEHDQVQRQENGGKMNMEDKVKGMMLEPLSRNSSGEAKGRRRNTARKQGP